MKRQSTYIIALIFLFLSSILLLTSCGSSSSLERLQENCIRIHIRANSNSQEDQAVKLKVRDAITAYLSGVLGGCKTKRDAKSVLESNKQKLVEIANSTLKQYNFTYKSRVRLSNEYFPDRMYDEYDFPAGNYDALVLELGSGKGDNWWCVAFPPLCFVPGTTSGEKIVYKSWIKELFDKMFGKA